MHHTASFIAFPALLGMLLLAGCSTVQQQQATTMGGIQGATTGAVIGAGNNRPIQGAIVGAVIGAATGAILSSPPPVVAQPIQIQENEQPASD